MFIFKFIWIIIGITIFMDFKLKSTSDMLMQFITVYFVGFIGGLTYLIFYIISLKIYNGIK